MERWTILIISHSIYLIDIKAHINFIGFLKILLFRHTLSMVLLVNKKQCKKSLKILHVGPTLYNTPKCHITCL